MRSVETLSIFIIIILFMDYLHTQQTYYFIDLIGYAIAFPLFYISIYLVDLIDLA